MTPGLPTRPGLYWLRITPPKIIRDMFRDNFTFVLQCWRHEGKVCRHLFGDGGSGPLEHYLNRASQFTLSTSHQEIPPPKRWIDYTAAIRRCEQIESHRSTKMWIRTAKGSVGLGLLISDFGHLSGDVVWSPADKIESGSTCGEVARQNWMFSPVEAPSLC